MLVVDGDVAELDAEELELGELVVEDVDVVELVLDELEPEFEEVPVEVEPVPEVEDVEPELVPVAFFAVLPGARALPITEIKLILASYSKNIQLA